jgi:parallel beta-helix repeat protein
MYGATGGIPVTSGTVLDLKYTSPDTTTSRVFSGGAGSWFIRDITFYASTYTHRTSILLTTNTTVQIESCAFLTGQSGAGCTIDGIRLGGRTVGTLTNNVCQASVSDSCGFQGYGSIIHGNYFNGIRTCIEVGNFGNNITISDNNVWNKCGGHSAILIKSWLVDQGCVGNNIRGNLIEMPNYVYGIKLVRSSNNTLDGNSFYDHGVSVVANYRFELASFNSIFSAFNSGEPLKSEDAASTNTNNVFSSDVDNGINVGTKAIFQQGVTLTGITNPWEILASDGRKWRGRLYSTNKFSIDYDNPGTETNVNILSLERASTTRVNAKFPSGTYLSCVTGDLRVFSDNGNATWLGGNGAQGYVLGGAALFPDGYRLGNAGEVQWSNSSSAGGPKDVALLRSAAGVMKVSNGGTGFGSISIASNRIEPMSAAAASALSPSNGWLIYVSDTNGTFTSVGFWGYQNNAWVKL